jgi:hypothetical protein
VASAIWNAPEFLAPVVKNDYHPFEVAQGNGEGTRGLEIPFCQGDSLSNQRTAQDSLLGFGIFIQSCVTG